MRNCEIISSLYSEVRRIQLLYMPRIYMKRYQIIKCCTNILKRLVRRLYLERLKGWHWFSQYKSLQACFNKALGATYRGAVSRWGGTALWFTAAGVHQSASIMLEPTAKINSHQSSSPHCSAINNPLWVAGCSCLDQLFILHLAHNATEQRVRK